MRQANGAKISEQVLQMKQGLFGRIIKISSMQKNVLRSGHLAMVQKPQMVNWN